MLPTTANVNSCHAMPRLPQNIRRPAKGQRKRIRKQSDAGDGDGAAAGKDAEARLREDLFGADNAGVAPITSCAATSCGQGCGRFDVGIATRGNI